ncbi:hypothetical protein [Chryseosolibacter indicus]|uniref:EF-hand domain-containing protein n=1 Tax=Chryseosolibacter indicus TaxID=2782351 RepID=A0ABS5VRY8_9BACT|nr:hypothetical protein [Chryseosolibacter indicus]MBT1702781.1 hypothetical protein [Chryseosolibacter indicus]
MKPIRMLLVTAILVLGWVTSYSQYSQAVEPEVPGDQFSLEGALELFKKSASPEEFERLLNSSDLKVNNLDLNGDGYIDYIRVFDRYEGNIHAFIMQAVISDNENQDIAVIELEKLANGKAVLQIIGDEDIYGIETIIEPTQEVRTYAGATTTNTVVNVWAWPAVQYVYAPRYTAWISPWGWYSRPVWWRTWRPVAYVHYYPVWRPYRPHYVVCSTRRIVYAQPIYRPHRTTSVIVYNMHHSKVEHFRKEHHHEYARRDRRDTRPSHSHDYNARREYGKERRREDFNDRRTNTKERDMSSRRHFSEPERNDRQRSLTPRESDHFSKPDMSNNRDTKQFRQQDLKRESNINTDFQQRTVIPQQHRTVELQKTSPAMRDLSRKRTPPLQQEEKRQSRGRANMERQRETGKGSE